MGRQGRVQVVVAVAVAVAQVVETAAAVLARGKVPAVANAALAALGAAVKVPALAARHLERAHADPSGPTMKKPGNAGFFLGQRVLQRAPNSSSNYFEAAAEAAAAAFLAAW